MVLLPALACVAYPAQFKAVVVVVVLPGVVVVLEDDIVLTVVGVVLAVVVVGARVVVVVVTHRPLVWSHSALATNVPGPLRQIAPVPVRVHRSAVTSGPLEQVAEAHSQQP
jgi:hypothetical protein